MPSKAVYQTISLLSAALVVGYYGWISTAALGATGAPIVAAVTFGLVLAILKIGVRELKLLWVAADSAQVPPILTMIVLGLIVQLGVGWILRWVGYFDAMASMIVFLNVWVCLPLLFLAVKIIRWPRRLAAPSVRTLLPIAVAAVVVGLILLWIGSVTYDGPRDPASLADQITGGLLVLSGASAEEVVFRVLLLTALARASGSAIHALIISSAVFALYHVPGAVSVPLLDGSWAEVNIYVKQFMPELVWTIALGFLCGALWIRTGSIVLICGFHALCNMGAIVAGGLAGL